MHIHALLGDLTKLRFDVVVNAANAALAGGGGLDGAIHRAAGPQLMDACRSLPQTRGIRCPVGEVRVTPGFLLPSPWILHAVGPIYATDPNPTEHLAAAYRNAFTVAEQRGWQRIGLPALSCGIYGFPPKKAAALAVGVCRERAWNLTEAAFVLADARLLPTWQTALGNP